MTKTPAIIDIAADEWVAACTASAASGCDVVDWLTAVDTAESLFVVVHLVDPGSSRSEMLRCELNVERPEIESITSWFPGSRLARTRDARNVRNPIPGSIPDQCVVNACGRWVISHAQDRSPRCAGEDPVARARVGHWPKASETPPGCAGRMDMR